MTDSTRIQMFHVKGPTHLDLKKYLRRPQMILEAVGTLIILVLVIGSIVPMGIGIMRAIDYVEENPYAAKDKIQKIVYTVVGLHSIFLFMGMPLWEIAFSLSIQYVLNTLFNSYPVIKPEDPRFIYGLAASLLNHFILIKFFVENTSSVIIIIFSFVLIWVTPLCFFLSLSASDDNIFANDRNKRPNKTYLGNIVDYLMPSGWRSGNSLKHN